VDGAEQNEAEAETVRHIFRRHAALRSVRLLAADLGDAGITSKPWVSTSGRHWGAQKLARGHAYRRQAIRQGEDP
jgi:hypothetical protein